MKHALYFWHVLPASTPPIIIVQHIPARFSQSLAKSLSDCSHIKVTVAVDGEVVEPSRAYLPPGASICGSSASEHTYPFAYPTILLLADQNHQSISSFSRSSTLAKKWSCGCSFNRNGRRWCERTYGTLWSRSPYDHSVRGFMCRLGNAQGGSTIKWKCGRSFTWRFGRPDVADFFPST
jgi:hypothetical protein